MYRSLNIVTSVVLVILFDYFVFFTVRLAPQPSTPLYSSSAYGEYKRQKPKPAPKLSFKQKHRIETAEKEVEKQRAALELLDRDLGDPGTFTHKADAEAKLKARAKVQAQLDAAEAEWHAALEAAEQ